MNVLQAAVLPTIEVPLLFCDIDGTVRHSKAELGRFVDDTADVTVYPEALDRIGKWRADGGRVVGVSNQTRVGLGIVAYEAMRLAMLETARQCAGMFDLILACVHRRSADCWCSKPKVGMLVEAVALLSALHSDESYPLDRMLMVGDLAYDMTCAHDAGVRFQYAEQWRAGW